MLRFYVKRVGNTYVIINDTFDIDQRTFFASELGDIDTQFAELHVNINPGTPLSIMDNLEKVIPMDVQYIRPEALKATHDNNLEVLNSPVDELKPYNAQEMREDMQEIIDRFIEYGDDFRAELSKLLERFPITPVTIDNKVVVIG